MDVALFSREGSSYGAVRPEGFPVLNPAAARPWKFLEALVTAAVDGVSHGLAPNETGQQTTLAQRSLVGFGLVKTAELVADRRFELLPIGYEPSALP